MNYTRAENFNLGNVISDIVLEDLIEANPTETWNSNESMLLDIISSGSFTDTNTQETIICGFNIDIGTVAYGARPYNNSLNLESMMI